MSHYLNTLDLHHFQIKKTFFYSNILFLRFQATASCTSEFYNITLKASGNMIFDNDWKIGFLAATAALEVQMLVCLSVCL